MKFVLALMLSFSAFSAFAQSVSEVVSTIETERRVRCEFVKNGFEVCIGMPKEYATCRYTKTYFCEGDEVFTLKLKVKEYLSTQTYNRETVVTDIQIQ